MHFVEMGSRKNLKATLIFTVLLFGNLIDLSVEDCRVLADCDGGQTRWQNLTRGTQGRPGKRGLRGPSGQKGEPGLGVNITEVKELLSEGKKGPQLYRHVPTLTWHTSKSFCQNLDRTLCTMDQICPPKDGGRELIRDVIPGDHWVAVLNTVNEWVEIGDHHVLPCIYHNPRWNPPSWGITTVSSVHKGYIFCCEVDESRPSNNPDIRYQYIGKAATYASSQAHCENQGRRLCYTSEVCTASKPVLGTVKGDKWIAVRDRFNDWIQIGDNGGRTCKTHGIISDLPSWGVRVDGTLLDYVGYVYCCKNT